MLDTFLSPLSNYNILVVIGPIGCGKTTMIKQELEKFKDSISISYNNLNFTKVNTLSLDGRIIIKVIDPADNLEIPNIILKHQSKYILVANSLENLSSVNEAASAYFHRPLLFHESEGIKKIAGIIGLEYLEEAKEPAGETGAESISECEALAGALAESALLKAKTVVL